MTTTPRNVRYCYHFTNTFSFDPIARGESGHYSLVTVIEPGSPFEAEVYRPPVPNSK